MSRWEEASAWGRMVVGYAIWFVVLIILRRVILSLHGVQEIGFAVYPFQASAYPIGLHWAQIFDMILRTILIICVLALGGRLGEVLSSALPRVPRLGRMGSLGMALGALIIGYYAYAPLVLPPLASQGVQWAYNLIFWVFAAGILAFLAFEFAHMVSAVAVKGDGSPKLPSSATHRDGVQAVSCAECSEPLSPGDRYCPSCGAPAVESETQTGVDGLIPPLAEPVTPDASGSCVTGASHDAALKERVIRLTRSTAAGATGKHMLGQFLEMDAEYEPYKALLVTFMSLPPDVRKTRFLAIPTSKPLEATALEVVGPEALETWDRMAFEGLTILAQRSGGP